MEWIERLNKALRYVEENLEEKVDFAEVANQAYTSGFHFQRLFSVVSGITLAEYIRRRRLTLAASEIQEGSDILETAVKYGYESQASFTRAFSRMHGVTPGQSREPGVTIKAYPPLSFQLSIKGEHSMDYEIRKMGNFKIAGHKRRFTSKDGKNYVDIPQFWQESCEKNWTPLMMSKAAPQGNLKGALLGVCLNHNDADESFDYMIAMEPKDDADLKDLCVVNAEPKTWAIFKGEGTMPEAIQKTWHRIFQEWFPATEYINDEGPQMEVYFDEKEGGVTPFEIWIPVTKG